jgi:uncharacterized protein YdhG (YjbR/CyaY superfamily)
MMKSWKTVDAYVAGHPAKIATRLRAVRKAIRECAPSAVEGISYGMPGYKLAGKPLVYFAAQTHHVGFYALPSGVAAFKKELSKYQTSKGTIQFQHDEPLPLPLIKRIVRARVKENLSKMTKKTVMWKTCSRGHKYLKAPCPKCWPGGQKKKG